MRSFQQFQEYAGLASRNPSASRPQPINRTNDQVQKRELHDKKLSRMNAHKKTTTNKEVYEVYDPEIQGRSQIKQMGDGGRKQPKKDTVDRRKPGQSQRMKAVGGGKMAPVGSYKDRKDIGTTKARSEREQQPTKERGSARQSQLDAAKEERKKAARARIAAKKAGGDVKKTTTSSKDTEKKATQLLKTKKTEPKKSESKPRRSWKTADGGGMTRKERDAARGKEDRASKKTVKSQLRSEFEKKHGRKPNSKESIQLTAKANAANKALK